MKKQQWLFNFFSKTLTPLLNSSTSYNNNALRPFCSTATTTTNTTNTHSLFAAVNNKNELHKLLEKKKKLPLLIVPYNHLGGGGGDLSKKERRLGSSVCDDTLGVMSLFHGDGDHDDELDKKKKKEEVYKLSLPEIADRRICGSSEGWLVTVHENSEVQLLNPISRVLVHLPPLITSFPDVVGKLVLEENRGLCYLVRERRFHGCDSHYFRESFFKKVVTSTHANSTLPTVVMAIYGDGNLAFCRPSSTGNGIDDDEQNKWICCHLDGYYEDVTFCKGNFYLVSRLGDVVVVKGLDGPSPFVESIIENSNFRYYPKRNYLVESSSSSGGGGDLLMVMRNLEREEENEEEERPCTTIGFRVLKLDFNGPTWVEVTNLGKDCALFIGYNHSFSFSASKFPGCRGNCIYFTDDHILGKGHDMGVYNLEDASIEKLYETSSKLFIPPPIWYVPNTN